MSTSNSPVVTQERKTKLVLQVTTYGTEEQCEDTLAGIVREIKLRGYNVSRVISSSRTDCA